MVYIIILNFNSIEDTLECVASIYEKEKRARYKIIVIDNGSAQFDDTLISKRFPETVIVKLPQNLGFAGGVNVGIKMALRNNASHVLLLNNDTVVTENFLTHLLDTMNSAPGNETHATPAPGIVAPLITYYDNPQKIWYAGGTFNDYLGITRHKNMNRPRNIFGSSHAAVATPHALPASPTSPASPASPAAPFETPFITGCCMLIAAEVFKKIGLFDEDYFLYNEDLDFCYRCRKAGIKLAVNPRAEILHKISGSSSKEKNANADPHHFNKIKAYHCAKNDFTFIRKNLRGLKKITATLSSFLIKHPYFMLYLLRKKKFPELKEYAHGMHDGIMNKTP